MLSMFNGISNSLCTTQKNLIIKSFSNGFDQTPPIVCENYATPSSCLLYELFTTCCFWMNSESATQNITDNIFWFEFFLFNYNPNNFKNVLLCARCVKDESYVDCAKTQKKFCSVSKYSPSFILFLFFFAIFFFSTGQASGTCVQYISSNKFFHAVVVLS